jgi:hypothetical protein
MFQSNPPARRSNQKFYSVKMLDPQQFGLLRSSCYKLDGGHRRPLDASRDGRIKRPCVDPEA